MSAWNAKFALNESGNIKKMSYLLLQMLSECQLSRIIHIQFMPHAVSTVKCVKLL